MACLGTAEIWWIECWLVVLPPLLWIPGCWLNSGSSILNLSWQKLQWRRERLYKFTKDGMPMGHSERSDVGIMVVPLLQTSHQRLQHLGHFKAFLTSVFKAAALQPLWVSLLMLTLRSNLSLWLPKAALDTYTHGRVQAAPSSVHQCLSCSSPRSSRPQAVSNPGSLV